jgi:type IV fimbrial biogenesis protein FimT
MIHSITGKNSGPSRPSGVASRRACPETRRQHRQHGLTLIELLVALSVLVIVLAIGVPTFRDLIDYTRLTTATNSLMASANLARAEAVKRGVPVSVCTSADGASCSGSTDWSEGWILFTNKGWSSPPAPGAEDEIIQVAQSIGPNVLLGASHAYVQYYPQGSARTF